MPYSTIGPIPFSLTGTANTNAELLAIDLSGCRHIRLTATLTGVGTADAGDTLNIYFQEAGDDATPTWDDRAAFAQFTGAMTPSDAAPEKRIMEWPCLTNPILLTDEIREPSGSAGASRLVAGVAIPGPLKGKRRVPPSAALVGPQPRYRLRYEVVDTNANATFAGNVLIDFMTLD